MMHSPSNTNLESKQDENSAAVANLALATQRFGLLCEELSQLPRDARFGHHGEVSVDCTTARTYTVWRDEGNNITRISAGSLEEPNAEAIAVAAAVAAAEADYTLDELYPLPDDEECPESEPAINPAPNEATTDRPAFPEPDCDQLEIFVDALFRHCSNEGFVSLRSFYHDGDKPCRITPISLKGGLKFLMEAAEDDARRAANNPKAVVFCPPIAVFNNAKHAREEDLLEGPVLSVELDENPRAALTKLEQLLGPATLVVRSGGKWTNPTTGEVEDKLHAHWRLKRPAQGEEQLAKLKELRRLATNLVGADRSNIPINHPIRWPGSWHRKSTLRLCEIVSTEHIDNEIDLDVALAGLEDVAPPLINRPETQRLIDKVENEVPPDPPNKIETGIVEAFMEAGLLPKESVTKFNPPSEDLWGDPYPKTANPDRIAAALAVIPNSKRLYVLRGQKIDGSEDDELDWQGWNSMGMATWNATSGSAEGLAAFDAFSKKSPKYNAQTTAERWAAYSKSPPTQLGAGTIFYLADQASPGWREEYEAGKVKEQPGPQPGPQPQPDADEAGIPSDTLREIQNPRSKKLWNVVMVLKDKGYTVDSSLALFEKYPTGMYAKYRGRLQNEVEKIWAKLRKGEETKDEVPPAALLGPPLPIDETIKIFQRWLLLEDDTPVYAVLGTIAANYLEGDPVWLGVIGPPSSAKTEILNATSMLPHVVQAATLTVAGLLSGTPKRQQTAGAKGGLLQQIGEFGIITLKDFGSILSMHTETRAEVLAALREIYDGAWTRHIGSDGGRTLAWKGKVGLVFAATEVIDSHYAVIGAMGDRFLLSRLAPTPGQPQFKRALAHLGGTTKQMRKELAAAIAQLFAGRRPQPQPISNAEANCIGEVISLAVRLRGAVERDRRTREIDAIYGAEGTARIGLALERLLAGLDTLGVDRAKALAIVKRVALDSVPPLRRRAYDCVCKHNPVETADVAIELGLPTNTARRILEELAAHGLVIRRSQGPGKADLWDRANWETEDKKAEEKLNSHSQKNDEEPDPSGAVYALRGMKQPETVPCAYCGQTGDVYQFADGSLPKDQRQHSALHAGCAAAFFTGPPG